MQHGIRVEPQAGKNLALENSVPRLELAEFLAVQDEPVNRPILDAPDHVFPNAIASISIELFVQIVTDTACRDFAGKLGSAVDVTIHARNGLTAEFRQN